jgi:predicted dehydrogenase
MRVGIIGCGAIAARAHIPAFLKYGADIVALADIDLNRANRLAKRFNIPHVFSDYHELLATNVELVSICTPPQKHASMAIAAANAGKNILLEKPMAGSVEDAESIIHACKMNDVKLCMMHEYRFIPCIQEAKRRVASGRLGQIIAIAITAHPQFPMRWSDSEWLYEKWSLLDDVGVHYLDILAYLTHAVAKHVSVVARDTTGKLGFFDYIQATIELEGSCVAQLDLSWAAGSYELTSRVFGTAGRIDIDIRNDYLSELHGYVTPIDEIHATMHKSWRTVSNVLRRRYFRGALLYHELLIRDFLARISKDEDPPVGPEEGRVTIELMEQIKRAAD